MTSDSRSNQAEAFHELKKDFEATIIRELLPGILHNFANPLNGIMGRAKLLQRRAYDRFKVSENAGTADETISGDGAKIINDIDLIAKETDRLFDLFKDVAGKIYRLSDSTIQEINLSHLIETEMAFLNFYLDFKHTVEKELRLDRNIPAVNGVTSDYSMAFSALIRHSMMAMKESPSKKLTISTYYEEPHVCVRIEDTGNHSISKEERRLLESITAVSSPFYNLDGNAGLFNALSLLKKYDARFDFDEGPEIHRLHVRIPH